MSDRFGIPIRHRVGNLLGQVAPGMRFGLLKNLDLPRQVGSMLTCQSRHLATALPLSTMTRTALRDAGSWQALAKDQFTPRIRGIGIRLHRAPG